MCRVAICIFSLLSFFYFSRTFSIVSSISRSETHIFQMVIPSSIVYRYAYARSFEAKYKRSNDSPQNVSTIRTRNDFQLIFRWHCCDRVVCHEDENRIPFADIPNRKLQENWIDFIWLPTTASSIQLSDANKGKWSTRWLKWTTKDENSEKRFEYTCAGERTLFQNP